MPDPKPDDSTVQEQTDSVTYADDPIFYNAEKWTSDGTKIDGAGLLTPVMPLSELVLVTILVVALLIVAVMLYPA